jgi:hypothetical protein
MGSAAMGLVAGAFVLITAASRLRAESLPVTWDACTLKQHKPTDQPEFSILVDGSIVRRAGIAHTFSLLPTPGSTSWIDGQDVYLEIESIESGIPEKIKYVSACRMRWHADAFVDLDRIAGGDIWRVTVLLSPQDGASMGLDPGAARNAAASEASARLRGTVERLMRARVRSMVGQALATAKTPKPAAAIIPDADQAFQERIAELQSHADQQNSAQNADMVGQLSHAEQTRELEALEAIEGDVLALGVELRTANTLESVRPALDKLSRGEDRGALEYAVCLDTYLSNVLASGAQLWTLGTFDLPTTSAEWTLTLATGSHQTGALTLDDREGAVTVWVTQLPEDVEDVRFEWVAGARTSLSLGQLVASFVGSFAAVTMPGTAKGGPQPAGFNGLVSGPHWFENTCGDAATTITYAAHAFTPIAKLHTAATTTATLAPSKLEGDRTYAVYACNGPCTTDQSKSTALAQGTLTTLPNWGFTLFGALTYDLREKGRHAPYFTLYQWKPSTPNASGSQLYRLDEVRQPLESVASSLLLAVVSPGRTFAIGFGPDILLGDGSGKLSQWTVNLFLTPPCWTKDGLYFTAGTGFRLYNSPSVGRYGDVVQASSMPTLVLEPHAEWVFSVGIALNLAVVGDAASSIFGAKGAATGGKGATP